MLLPCEDTGHPVLQLRTRLRDVEVERPRHRRDPDRGRPRRAVRVRRDKLPEEAEAVVRRRSQGALMKKVLLAVVTVLSVLSAAPVRADEKFPAELEFERILKPFSDWLNWLETTTWFGFVLKDPLPWNGKWPERVIPAQVSPDGSVSPVPAKVLEFEPGGILSEHVKRWQDLAVKC
jgi:hypothetical protein